jgi:hypothetical protein
MVDDRLTATLEQIKQTDLAIGALKDVLFVHPDHRQSATLGVHTVTVFSEFLLVSKERFSLSQPLFSRYNLRMRYGRAFHDNFSFGLID